MKSNGRTRKDEEELVEERAPEEQAASKSPAQELVSMQQTVGNQAVARMLGTPKVARETATKPPAAPPAQAGKVEEDTFELDLVEKDTEAQVGPDYNDRKKTPGGKTTIKIKTFNVGVATPGAEPGGAPSGKAKASIMMLTKDTDANTPYLFKAATKNVAFAKAEVRHSKAGKIHMKYVLTDASVVSHQIGASEGGAGESFGLSYSGMEIEMPEAKTSESADFGAQR